MISIILNLLRERGPLSRTQIEAHVAAAGYAPAGVNVVLWQLKRAGRVRHMRRACRRQSSLYALEGT